MIGQQTIEIKAIDWTRTQPRLVLDRGVVQEYSRLMKDGAQFPPIAVFFSSAEDLLGADGWHRSEAKLALGDSTIVADVRPGEIIDALEFGITFNSKYTGMRFQQADRMHALEQLLQTVSHKHGWRLPREWSITRIAELVGVSQGTVARMAERLNLKKRRYSGVVDDDLTTRQIHQEHQRGEALRMRQDGATFVTISKKLAVSEGLAKKLVSDESFARGMVKCPVCAGHCKCTVCNGSGLFDPNNIEIDGETRCPECGGIALILAKSLTRRVPNCSRCGKLLLHLWREFK